MDELVAEGTAELFLSYHQFVIIDDGLFGPDRESLLSAHETGLAGSEPGAVDIVTGIHTGYVRVTVATYRWAPRLELTGWEDVVEVSAHSSTGTMFVTGISEEIPEGLPNPASAGPGQYRVRVYATGRDTAVDLTADEPVEDYRLAIWPADPAPPVVHAMTSEYGRGMRDRAAQRRGSREHSYAGTVRLRSSWRALESRMRALEQRWLVWRMRAAVGGDVRYRGCRVTEPPQRTAVTASRGVDRARWAGLASRNSASCMFPLLACWTELPAVAACARWKP